MSSNISPCGRYEYTGETKIIEGYTVKRYRVRDDADPGTLPKGVTPGEQMGFIDDWGAVQNGGSVRGDGVAIKSTIYNNAVVWGRADGSELWGDAIVRAGAYVSECDINDASMILRGAHVTNVTLQGDSIVRDNAVVRGRYHEIFLSSVDIPSNAEILGDHHLLTLMVTTTSQLRTLVYRKKGGGARVVMGCWSGTIDELEELFMRSAWVETEGEDCEHLRPKMLAMVAFFKQMTASW